MGLFFKGSFVAGSARAIEFVYREFYAIHDQWLDEHRFAGKEQNIFNELVLVRSTTRHSIVRLKSYDLNCSYAFDKWFLYQHYLARPNEYFCFHDKNSLLLVS